MLDDQQYQKLLADAQAYLMHRYDLVRLGLVEKLSLILGKTLLVVVAVLLGFGVLSMLAFALVAAFACVVPEWAAYLIVAAVYVLLLVVALLNARRWFIDPMVRQLSAIIFSEENDNLSEAQGKEAEHA